MITKRWGVLMRSLKMVLILGILVWLGACATNHGPYNPAPKPIWLTVEAGSVSIQIDGRVVRQQELFRQKMTGNQVDDRPPGSSILEADRSTITKTVVLSTPQRFDYSLISSEVVTFTVTSLGSSARVRFHDGKTTRTVDVGTGPLALVLSAGN